MKILIPIALFFAVGPLSAQGIPKHTNTIIVKQIGFNEISMALVDAGYFIDKRDSSLGTIITIPRHGLRVNSIDGNVIIRIRVKDSTAFITGMYNMDIVLKARLTDYDFRDYEKIEKRGMKGSAYMQAFDKLNGFALSLQKETTYQITP